VFLTCHTEYFQLLRDDVSKIPDYHQRPNSIWDYFILAPSVSSVCVCVNWGAVNVKMPADSAHTL